MKRRSNTLARRADLDLRSAGWQMKAPEEDANFGLVCYLCAQCVEKYMKAALCELDYAVPHHHDLDEILTKLVDVYPLWEGYRRDFGALQEIANTRYSDEDTSPEQAEWSTGIARAFRGVARSALGLD